MILFVTVLIKALVIYGELLLHALLATVDQKWGSRKLQKLICLKEAAKSVNCVGKLLVDQLKYLIKDRVAVIEKSAKQPSIKCSTFISILRLLTWYLFAAKSIFLGNLLTIPINGENRLQHQLQLKERPLLNWRWQSMVSVALVGTSLDAGTEERTRPLMSLLSMTVVVWKMWVRFRD